MTFPFFSFFSHSFPPSSPGAWRGSLCMALCAVVPLPAGAASTPVVDEGEAALHAWVRQQGRQVLSFVGYSGAGYEDPQAMLAIAGRVLDGLDPARTVVAAGATAEGIGAVYGLARQRGFVTLGIVSSLARDEGVALSPHVDRVFYIPDPSWGGRLPGGGLAPTSAALVAVSDSLVGIGGGEIARDELLAARAAGKAVSFFPADMQHQAARDKAAARGSPAPQDFRGAADPALLSGR